MAIGLGVVRLYNQDGAARQPSCISFCFPYRYDRFAKLKKFRLYDFRHTLLTRLGEAGADAFVLQKIAGHSTITVSQRYVHPTPERVEDAFSRLERYNARKAEELEKKRKTEEESESMPAAA